MRNLFLYLRGSVLRHAGAGQTDRDLLECFRDRRDEAAFTALLQRHGPMVLAVAHRLLGHAQDAEDVFQATFLVLVRKAAAIRRTDCLGPWLHRVALRTALEARTRRTRRRAREVPMKIPPDPAARPTVARAELREVLDEELNRLAAKYREAIVLCELQGRSRAEAAEVLHIPEGTLSSRLATARKYLARGLARRGLGLPAVALGACLAGNLEAHPAAALVSATAQSAVQMARGGAAVASPEVLSLVNGVLKAMFLTRLRFGALLVLVVGVAALAWTVISQGAGPVADPPPAANAQEKPVQAPDAGAKAKKDRKAKPDPKVPDVIRPGDRLNIRVPGALPDSPVNGVFVVEASGKVALGPPYGRVEVQGMTPEQAEEVVALRLKTLLKDPNVGVTRHDPLSPVVASADLEKLGQRMERMEKELQLLRAAIERLEKKLSR
jgi:RNA polymerase sigma factor (sigma-70 family)